MAVTKIDPGGDCPEGILSWPLPGILREIEIGAGPALVRDLIEALETDARERIRLALGAADPDDQPAQPLLLLMCEFAPTGSQRPRRDVRTNRIRR
jgi:hypothetical protein